MPQPLILLLVEHLVLELFLRLAAAMGVLAVLNTAALRVEAVAVVFMAAIIPALLPLDKETLAVLGQIPVVLAALIM